MHVYEVRDTQLQQHADKLSRLVLAFAQRAAQQQPVFRSSMKSMEDRLQAYKLEQSKRIKDLDTASGSAALKTLTDAATRTQLQFSQELKKWKTKMATQADDARAALVSSSNSALQFMSTFENGGNYNPEELEASRSRLQVLIADAEKRQSAWDAAVDEAIVKHGAEAEQALKEFTDLVKNVARDLDMAESAEKEARAAELARQMQSADNDRAMEVLIGKVERIEKLTAAHAAAATSESATRPAAGGAALVTAAVLESVCVASVLMRELTSCRWRVRSRAKFLECLVTDMAVDKAVVADDVLAEQWEFTAPADLAQLDKFNLSRGQGFSVTEEQQAEEKDWDQQPMSKAVAAAVEKQKVKLADLYKVTPLLPSDPLCLTPIFVSGVLRGAWWQVHRMCAAAGARPFAHTRAGPSRDHSAFLPPRPRARRRPTRLWRACCRDVRGGQNWVENSMRKCDNMGDCALACWSSTVD
jgi:hypothetical protein